MDIFYGGSLHKVLKLLLQWGAGSLRLEVVKKDVKQLLHIVLEEHILLRPTKTLRQPSSVDCTFFTQLKLGEEKLELEGDGKSSLGIL